MIFCGYGFQAPDDLLLLPIWEITLILGWYGVIRYGCEVIVEIFVLGYYMLSYDHFHSCKILDSKCMYWSIVSIWYVGLSSNVCTCLKFGSLLYSKHLRPQKKNVPLLQFLSSSCFQISIRILVQFALLFFIAHTLLKNLFSFSMSCIWKRQIWDLHIL